MFRNDSLDIKELIKITNSGITVATYAQIKASLIERYKQIYGSDIDVSDTCADGIFISDLALIINNILQSCQFAFSNLDINTASGVYLDRLCYLTNMTRKSATKSTAQIVITNLSSAPEGIIIENSMKFMDKAGVLWTYIGETFTLAASATSSALTLECDEYGAIEAPAGWIIKPVELMSISVTQSSDAIVGHDEESDKELRARQAASNGNQGITVLNGLINDLRVLEGVEDVYIFNNNTNNPIASGNAVHDNTSVQEHSIYILIRQANDYSKDQIGKTIFEDLTPGITTSPCDGSVINGTQQTYVYEQDISDPNGVISFNTNVYWKKCTPIHPTITISLKPLEYFNDTSEITEVANDVMTYLNNLSIMKNLSVSEVLAEVVYADPQFKGKPTYITTSVSIASADANGVFQNTGTYYYYHTVSTPTTSNGIITFTLS